MTDGWKGKILRVDLAEGKINTEALPEEWRRAYIGCRGICDILLYREVGPEVNPFSAKNKLILGTGPLEGTPIGMGRVSVQTKHPNRFIGEGGAGGHWGAALKFAGYDFLVIENKAETPSYLFIHDDQVEIRDGKDLWGKDTHEKCALIREKTGISNIQVACIGQAGERKVANAKVVFTLDHTGGRGCGTVMGDKRLAAIAVHGTGSVSLRNPQVFLDAYRRFRKVLNLKNTMDPFLPGYAFMSANQQIHIFNEKGWVHACNAQRGSIEDLITGEDYIAEHVTRPETSFCCPLPACGRRFELKSGKYKGISGDEREVGFVLASAVAGINSWPVALKFRDLCNRSGLDEFQAAYTIGWAMECYEKGILSRKDTDDIPLTFGNEDAFIEMTEKIIAREGFGDILARGSQEASEIIGQGSERFLLTIKGRELETMPQRGCLQSALALAVCEGGPDHTRWYPPYPPNPKTIPTDANLPFDPVNIFDSMTVDDKGAFVKWLYDTRAVLESLPTCVFILRSSLGIDMKLWLDLFNACTGASCSIDEFMKIGERIVNLERVYVAREGFGRKDDKVPRRMLEEPILDKQIPPIGSQLDTMLDDYYRERGWDLETGLPKTEKLRELDLDFAIDDLNKIASEA